ncbi:embigin [Hemicordylus capensis]|uniref:embigin n=1 Tax=Hemicordylus capensis TaxID=884348 RepID=UPI0023049FA0|nr:embigin [Hemicordylus capensis]
MSGSAACPMLFLLFLAPLGSSDATSFAVPTTQNISTKTSYNASSGTDLSTKVPPITTQQSEQKTSTLIFKKENLTISGQPIAKMEKNVLISRPTELELLCSLTRNPSMNMEKMDVVWKMNNKTIDEQNITKNDSKNSWCTWNTVKIRNQNEMGNYTCVFKTGEEIYAYGSFFFKVPGMKGKSAGEKSKQIVSYIGDVVALTCEIGNYTSVSWSWYKHNGSEQVAINETLMPEKYRISQEYYNKTKLMVHNLSEKDSGDYECRVVFELGESKGHVSLKVLSYLVPLKPFLGIAAEVIVLVVAIFLYEFFTKKKEAQDEVEKEFEQVEQLKSEDSNGVENSTTRQRKV